MNRKTKKNVKTISSVQKVPIYYKTLKNYSFSDTIPLNYVTERIHVDFSDSAIGGIYCGP